MPSPVYKNILCIRPDNMGDIIMSGPAIRALRQSFCARITLLTSPMGQPITPLIPDIDETIVANLPWTPAKPAGSNEFSTLIALLQSKQFDLAVIFTVYSQNPLPAALLCWQAGIPSRAAYCRENPYALLTHWLPDPEPYSFIRHQVERDILLVRYLGAGTRDRRLALRQDASAIRSLGAKLETLPFEPASGYIVLHPGVTEVRREYPHGQWVRLARRLHRQTRLPLLVTGGEADREKMEQLAHRAGDGVYNLAGALTLAESAALIRSSHLLISVNTAASHIAAAVGTPVLVLYAMTNPQHTPWQAEGKVFLFGVDKTSWSRNEVIRYVCERQKAHTVPLPTPREIVDAAIKLLSPGPLRTRPAYLPATHRAGITFGGSSAGTAPAL